MSPTPVTLSPVFKAIPNGLAKADSIQSTPLRFKVRAWGFQLGGSWVGRSRASALGTSGLFRNEAGLGHPGDVWGLQGDDEVMRCGETPMGSLGVQQKGTTGYSKRVRSTKLPYVEPQLQQAVNAQVGYRVLFVCTV